MSLCYLQLTNKSEYLHFCCFRQYLLELSDKPLERVFRRVAACAGFFAIKRFGCVEQGPAPAVFLAVLVLRIHEVFGDDVGCHLQLGDVAVELRPHTFPVEAASCPQLPSDEASSHPECIEDGTFSMESLSGRGNLLRR